jgi:hypothetical protein
VRRAAAWCAATSSRQRAGERPGGQGD